MADNDHIVGDWIDLTDEAEYRRLTNFARRSLVGYEYAADDVVINAVLRWRKISPTKQGVARIEQVVKSEARSFLRSEDRRRHREHRWASDAVRCGGQPLPWLDHERRMLMRSLLATAARMGIEVTPLDRQVLVLVFCGLRESDMVREIPASRHRVRRSKAKWRRVAERNRLQTPTA